MEMEDNNQEKEGSPAAGEGEGFTSVEIPHVSTAAEPESAADSVDQVIIFQSNNSNLFSNFKNLNVEHRLGIQWNLDRSVTYSILFLDCALICE